MAYCCFFLSLVSLTFLNFFLFKSDFTLFSETTYIFSSPMFTTGCSKLGSLFDQQWNKNRLILNFFALNKAYLNLDFDVKIVDICRKMNEIYSFEVEHSEFYESNFCDFWVVNFQISCQL